MGQQQLFILVLGLVIVGIAVFVGINAFNDQLRQNEADTMLNRSVSIAQEAIAWRGRSRVVGGGEGSFAPLDTLGFEALAMSNDHVTGQFVFHNVTPTTITVTGVSTRFPEIGARVTVTDAEVSDTQVRYDGTITLP